MLEKDVPFSNNPPPLCTLDYQRGELDKEYQTMRRQKLRELLAQNWEKDIVYNDFLFLERYVLERQYLYEYPVADYEKGGVLYENAARRADADWQMFKAWRNFTPPTPAELSVPEPVALPANAAPLALPAPAENNQPATTNNLPTEYKGQKILSHLLKK